LHRRNFPAFGQSIISLNNVAISGASSGSLKQPELAASFLEQSEIDGSVP
jgi:hypothetical protein